MKKIITIIAIALVCLCAFTACSGDKLNGKVTISGTQETSYEVVGNGGSAVQYGNYLYFINGSRGYDDTDGTNNVYGNVIKGALYRAELVGKADIDGVTFTVERDAETGLKLVSHKDKSYDNKDIDVVDVQLICPKTIGTSGYADGGLYIYNEYVYFASPCNGKDRDGNVMSDYNDFFRTNLITGVTQNLETSSSKNSGKPYGYYYQDGKVYLTYVETGDSDSIMSVVIDESTGKTIEKNIIAEKVTDVVMPVKSNYYEGIDVNGVEDFIYYGGNGSDVAQYRTDKLMSFVRPSGKENTIFSSGSDATLIGVEGGMVLYKITIGANTAIRATDMHNYFMSGSESYKAAFGDQVYSGAFDADQTVIANTAVASATAIDCFVPGVGVTSNSVYVVLTAANATTSTNNDLTLYSPNGSVKVIDSAASAKFLGFTTDRIIYSDTVDGKACLYTAKLDGSDIKSISTDITVTTFTAEVEAGFIIYFGTIEDTFSGYTLFYDLNGLDGANDSIFVGEKLASDVRSNVGSIKLDTDKAKISYTVGESLDVSGVLINAYSFADKDGEVQLVEENVQVTADMVSGFDSTTVTDSVTLTVTYKSVTDTYTISVSSASSAKTGCGSIGANPGDFIGGMLILAAAAGVLLLFRKKRIAA